MDPLPTPLLPARWGAARPLATGATLLGFAGIGAAGATLLGDAVDPAIVCWSQLAAAAGVAVVAGAGCAVARPLGKLVASGVFSVTAGVLIYALSPHDPWGLYFISAIVTAIVAGAASVGISFAAGAMVAAIQRRAAGAVHALEHVALLGASWIATTWVSAVIIAVVAKAPFLALAPPAVVALGALARVSWSRAARRRFLNDVAAGRAPGTTIVPILDGGPPDLDDVPSLEAGPPGVGAREGMLCATDQGGGPFRGAPVTRPLVRVPLTTPSPTVAAVSAVMAAVTAFAIVAAAPLQWHRLRVVWEWRQKPTCDWWAHSSVDAQGRTPIEAKAHEIAPSVRLAVIALDPSHRAHLYVVGKDDVPVPRADLDALARGVWDTCRWDERYDARPALVATNAEVVPVDLAVTFIGLPGVVWTPEMQEQFAAVVGERIRRSFAPGPTDGRQLYASDCWHYLRYEGSGMSMLVDVHEFAVYQQQVDARFNGGNSCFPGRETPAFPSLGRLDVHVAPR